MTHCSSPARNHGDGRGCQDENCPRHGGIDSKQDLQPRDTCDCGTRLRNGWCGTCREFIWRMR